MSPSFKKIHVFLLAALVALLCRAEPVQTNQVVRAVESWIAQKSTMDCPISGPVSSVRLCTPTNCAAFYVAKLAGGGFVVTSADTEIDPIIAFSPESDLVEDRRNPLWALLVGEMSARRAVVASRAKSRPSLMSVAAPGKLPAQSSSAASRWGRLTAEAPSLQRAGRNTVSDVRVAPLLKTKWGQTSDISGSKCFNYYTPRNYPCGCTATVGAQLLRYHKFPTESVAPHWYECSIDGYWDYRMQMGGVYDWDNMPYEPGRGTTDAQRRAIGKLTYDVSLAVDSGYTRWGTWGYADRLMDLCLDWGYAHATTFPCYCYDGWKERGYTERELKSVLIPNLDARLPVCARIYNEYWEEDSAHFVIADGYGYSDGQFFVHLNMGWTGASDAWYVLPDITADGDWYTSINYLYGNLYPEGPSSGAIASGRVLTTLSKPEPGVVVTARSAYGRETRTATTDAHGIYAFLLDSGAWTITIPGAVPETYSIWIDDARGSEGDCGSDADYWGDTGVVWDDEVMDVDASWSGNYYGLDFSVRVYAVTFDANGGTGSTTLIRNNKAELGNLPTPTRTGYSFLGWFTAATGGAEVKDSTLVTGEATYYAQWTPNVYTVVFDSNGGSGMMAPVTLVYDQMQALPANRFSKGNVAFRGWSLSPRRRVVYADGVPVVNLAESGTITLYASWEGEPVSVEKGRFCSFDLESDLGVVIDADYLAGDKVTLKLETLPKGLKLVTTPVYEDPDAKKKMVVGYRYAVEGVPTETLDFTSRPMFARVTVARKVGSKQVKEETLQRVFLQIDPSTVVDLPAGFVDAEYAARGIGAIWPAVADAEANPKEWSFKGWPSGIKFNSNVKPVTSSKTENGVKTVVTNALPYDVYGMPTKVGAYVLTATRSWKPDGKTAVKETFEAMFTVWAAEDEQKCRYETQAYADVLQDLGAQVTAASGLPSGLKFASKETSYKVGDVSATASPGSVYGMPTKPGVYAVQLTKKDPSDPTGRKTLKETFLWEITDGVNPGLGAQQIGWDAGKVAFDSVTAKATILQGAVQSLGLDVSALVLGKLSNNAKITVAGLPAGLAYDAKSGRISGIATKSESRVVTIKVVQNGVTTESRFAIDVVANPFAGTYYASFVTTMLTAGHLSTAVITPAAGGTAKVVFDEYVPSTGKIVKYTLNDQKGFEMVDAYDPARPEGAHGRYVYVLKADAKNNPDFGSVARTLTLDLEVAVQTTWDASVPMKFGTLRVEWDGGLSFPRTAEVGKAVTADEYASLLAAGLMSRPNDLLAVNVIESEWEGAVIGHFGIYSSAFDAKKLQYAVKLKLWDGTAQNLLTPLVHYSWGNAPAPFLLQEKNGARRAFLAVPGDDGVSFHTEEDQLYCYESNCSWMSPVPGSAAEMLGGDGVFSFDANEWPDAPTFLVALNGSLLEKAKLDIYAPGTEPGGSMKPLASISPVKLQTSAGYVFKGSFKWDAKVGGDGCTYAFELLPMHAPGELSEFSGSDLAFSGRCEVKPAKGGTRVCTARILRK